jgi:hypothetical protein
MLLKRIRAEREALAASKKKGGRTPKKRSGHGKKTQHQKADTEVEPEPAAPDTAKAVSAKKTSEADNSQKQATEPIEKRFEKPTC